MGTTWTPALYTSTPRYKVNKENTCEAEKILEIVAEIQPFGKIHEAENIQLNMTDTGVWILCERAVNGVAEEMLYGK